jgi:hypothetical protein
MPNDLTAAIATPEATSNQALAQDLLTQGLPTQSTDVLQVFMQFLANEVVNRVAKGESVEDCSALMDRYARFDSLRQRGIALKLRQAKAKAAAEASAQEAAEPTAPGAVAEAELSAASRMVASSPAKPAPRPVHLSRQQRRALLRKQTQGALFADEVTNPS